MKSRADVEIGDAGAPRRHALGQRAVELLRSSRVTQAERMLGSTPSSRIFVCGSRRCSSATTASMPVSVSVGRPVHAAEIVGADQDHRDLRRDAVDLAMLDAPEQMRGRVALEAEIERVAIAVEALPDRREILPRGRAVMLPVLRDGVAEEDEIDRMPRAAPRASPRAARATRACPCARSAWRRAGHARRRRAAAAASSEAEPQGARRRSVMGRTSEGKQQGQAAQAGGDAVIGERVERPGRAGGNTASGRRCSAAR